MARQNEDRTRRLAVVLLIVFGVAMVMGPGPGMYLINPDPHGTGPPVTLLGMPILYAWAVLWFFVQLAVVILAYVKVWSREGAAGDPPPDP